MRHEGCRAASHEIQEEVNGSALLIQYNALLPGAGANHVAEHPAAVSAEQYWLDSRGSLKLVRRHLKQDVVRGYELEVAFRPILVCGGLSRLGHDAPCRERRNGDAGGGWDDGNRKCIVSVM